MDKVEYKELKKKLKNYWVKPQGDYGLPSAVGAWFKQHNIKPSEGKLQIVCKIMGSVPYPHQEADRLVIIGYLKNTKYKEFKKQYEEP